MTFLLLFGVRKRFTLLFSRDDKGNNINFIYDDTKYFSVYFLPIESAAFIDHCYLGETVKSYKRTKCLSARSKDHKCFVKIPMYTP